MGRCTVEAMIEALIHLIILLARGSSAAPPRKQRQRQRRIGKIVLECPRCGKLGLAAQCRTEKYAGRELFRNSWRFVSDHFECGQCGKTINARACENDGTGVMRAKRWGCAACGAANAIIFPSCQNCGVARLVD